MCYHRDQRSQMYPSVPKAVQQGGSALSFLGIDSHSVAPPVTVSLPLSSFPALLLSLTLFLSFHLSFSLFIPLFLSAFLLLSPTLSFLFSLYSPPFLSPSSSHTGLCPPAPPASPHTAPSSTTPWILTSLSPLSHHHPITLRSTAAPPQQRTPGEVPLPGSRGGGQGWATRSHSLERPSSSPEPSSDEARKGQQRPWLRERRDRGRPLCVGG